MDTNAAVADHAHNRLFSLTRMVYALGGAFIVYELFGLLAWFLLRNALTHPLGPLRLSGFWLLHGANLAFVVSMIAATLPYSPKGQLFSWRIDEQTHVAGATMSVLWGIIGGATALAFTAPVFWMGDKQLGPITLLIADAMSLIGVLELLLIILALAISSEVLFRGVVFRTFERCASVPAAVIASCFLFAVACPVFGYPAAIILGVVAAVLFYRTRNLLASIIANALFTLGGGAIMLYRGFMH